MGRVSKVELFDLLERVIKLHGEHKSIKEIEAMLRGEGYGISRESIRRALKSSAQAASEYRKAYEESRALVEAVRSNPNTDVYETITSLLAGKILESVKGIEEINFEDPVGMALAVNKLADSQVKIARLRLEFQKGVESTKKAFLQALNSELEKYPELLARLTAVAATLEVKA